jgi:hypothetical protein
MAEGRFKAREGRFRKSAYFTHCELLIVARFPTPNSKLCAYRSSDDVIWKEEVEAKVDGSESWKISKLLRCECFGATWTTRQNGVDRGLNQRRRARQSAALEIGVDGFSTKSMSSMSRLLHAPMCDFLMAVMASMHSSIAYVMNRTSCNCRTFFNEVEHTYGYLQAIHRDQHCHPVFNGFEDPGHGCRPTLPVSIPKPQTEMHHPGHNAMISHIWK